MIKIGIVGIGGMGMVHYNNYLNIDGCKVVAAVFNSESSKEKIKELGLKAYDSIESMVKYEDIDVIDICTPTYLHKKQVIESLNHGKDVIVEKPIALHKVDAEEMFELASRQGKLLFVGQVVQFTRETEILRKIIQKKEYGEPLDGYFKRMAGRPKWVKDGWMFDREKSGVVPFDLHVHDLDLIISLFGKPKSFNFISSGRKDIEYKELYRINYKFENLDITAEAAWFNGNYPFSVGWRIYFEKGVLEYDGDNLILYQPDKEPFYYNIEDDIIIPTGINLPPTGMFHRELSHFIECIKNRTPSTIVDSKQIIATIEIMEEIVNIKI